MNFHLKPKYPNSEDYPVVKYNEDYPILILSDIFHFYVILRVKNHTLDFIICSLFKNALSTLILSEKTPGEMKKKSYNMVYLFNRTYYTSYCYAVVIPTIIIATIASLFSKGTFILEQSDSTLNRAFQLVVRSAFVFENNNCYWLNKSRNLF